MEKTAPAQESLDEFGIDAVCDLIAEGAGFRDIAKRANVGVGSVFTWLNNHPEHSARVVQTRQLTAALWDQMAEEEIRKAPKTKVGIARARELAQHFRWRSSKLNPRDYGDKMDLNLHGKVSLTAIPYDPDSLSAEDREVLQRLSLRTPPTIEHEGES